MNSMSVSAQTSHSSQVKLFNQHHVAIATFFGTPLAGAILMFLNDRKLSKDAWSHILVGFGLTFLAVAISFILPDRFPGTPIAIGLMFAMRAYAAKTQGADVASHLANGGALESGWKAFGISLIFLVPLLFLLFTLLSMGV